MQNGATGAQGLDYIPSTQEFLLTNGSNKFYRFQLASDSNSIITPYKNTQVSRTVSKLYGVGFNTSSNTIIFKDIGVLAEYAVGPKLEVLVTPAFADSNNPAHPEYTQAAYTIKNNSNDNNKATNIIIPSAGVLQSTIDPNNQANWHTTYDGNNLTVQPNVSGNGLAPGQNMTIYATSQFPTVADANATITTDAATLQIKVRTTVVKTLSGDLNDNSVVDINDINYIISNWLTTTPPSMSIREDINRDNAVNFLDFANQADHFEQKEIWYQ